MFGGGAFQAAWNAATSDAKSAAAAIATGGETVSEVTQVAAAKAVGVAKKVADTTLKAAHWAGQQTVKTAKWTANETVAAVEETARVAKSAFEAAKKAFTGVTEGAILMACVAENALVKEVANLGAQVLANPYLEPLQDVLLGAQPKDLAHDGETVGAGCMPKGSKSTGVLPQCPNGRIQTRGKATYINGINTDYHTGEKNADSQDGICKTMQELANATCAEVTGVYNATGGTRADIGECLTNIGKDSHSPAVATLRRLMFSALDQNPPQDMTIYAHSQGGLMTQEALADVKNKLTIEYGEADAVARMQQISVNSFGTAEQGWPVGPNYEQFTNSSDPVPGAIAGAQTNYPEATFNDSAVIPDSHRNIFNSPHLNPIDSHSMDNVYIPQMVKINGQPNCCS
jgi:hypothetical protein